MKRSPKRWRALRTLSSVARARPGFSLGDQRPALKSRKLPAGTCSHCRSCSWIGALLLVQIRNRRTRCCGTPRSAQSTMCGATWYPSRCMASTQLGYSSQFTNLGTFSITQASCYTTSAADGTAQAVDLDASCSGLPFFLPRAFVALAAWRGDADIGARNCCLVGLVQVLTYVICVPVIGCMPLHRFRPGICRPENLDVRGSRACAPSAKAGEQVDCCGHVLFLACRRGALAGAQRKWSEAERGAVMVGIGRIRPKFW